MIKTFNEITDYKEITSYQFEAPNKKTAHKAYCNSLSCNGSDSDYKLGKPKDVAKSTVFCKECGSALFWCSNILAKKYGVESRKNQRREEFRSDSRAAVLSMRERRRKLQPDDSSP